MVKKIGVIASIIILIALDQLSKLWIVNNVELGSLRPFLKGVFSLTYLQNRGAAFSMLQDQQWFFALITIIVVGLAIYYLIKHIDGSWWLLTGLVLVIAGELGNFCDRLRLGFVVDMVHLDFMDFAIFNVADAYLSVGVVILMIALWREEDGSHR